MNIIECCSLLQLIKKEVVPISEIGEVIGVSRQHAAKIKQKEIDEINLQKIEKYYNLSLPRQFVISEKAENEKDDKGHYSIPYWQGCPNCENMIKKEGISDLKLDIELINSEWKAKPENLRIIAMPGDDMNGGFFPIRNRDILIIDTARTGTFESGVFFLTSHNCSKVYVRRIIEQIGEYSFLTTVDNPYWQQRLEKKWTKEQWKDADIKIVGRVITNASYII